MLTSFFAVREELNMPSYKKGSEKKILPALVRSEKKKRSDRKGGKGQMSKSAGCLL